MKTREWILSSDTVDELYEYKNLGVLKNFIGSFSSNVDDNIEKTRNKARMIFSSHLDRRKVNPLIYVMFWRQGCLPSLLFGAELFKFIPGLLLKLERCQLHISSYENWKRIVRFRIRVFENDAWLQFCDNHPDIHIIQTCFGNMSPPDFWSLADECPDLVVRLHTQARLMGSFGLNDSVPWLKDTEGALGCIHYVLPGGEEDFLGDTKIFMTKLGGLEIFN